MANNYIQEGASLTLVAPTGGVVSGMIYIIGSFIVVASTTVAAGEEFEGQRCRVWELPKVAADTPATGDDAYLLADGTAITTVATGNTLVGTFTEPRANGDVLAYVLLKERV